MNLILIHQNDNEDRGEDVCSLVLQRVHSYATGALSDATRGLHKSSDYMERIRMSRALSRPFLLLLKWLGRFV